MGQKPENYDEYINSIQMPHRSSYKPIQRVSVFWGMVVEGLAFYFCMATLLWFTTIVGLAVN